MAKRTVTKNGRVDWFDEEVRLLVKDATDEGVRKAAFRVLDYAKLQIKSNNQIDTSFMWNSGYVVTPSENTYLRTMGGGALTNKRGQRVKRKRAPQAKVPPGFLALVAFGAVYAFWQELQQPFLYPALERTAKETGSILEKTAKEKGLT